MAGSSFAGATCGHSCSRIQQAGEWDWKVQRATSGASYHPCTLALLRVAAQLPVSGTRLLYSQVVSRFQKGDTGYFKASYGSAPRIGPM